VFERLIAAGEEFGLTPAGMHTMNTAGPKGYRHWGRDISDEKRLSRRVLVLRFLGTRRAASSARALLKQKALPTLPKRMVCWRSKTTVKRRR
jgi:glycine cleavage system aminomethyltransferase T